MEVVGSSEVFLYICQTMQPHEGNLESLIVLALSDGSLFVGNVLKRDVLSIIFCTMPVVMS
jgi:hypothetical protein